MATRHMENVCTLLKEGLCTSLGERCFSPNNRANCGWSAHNKWLQPVKGEPLINEELKQKIFMEARAKWKNYAKNRTGGRNMTARPFEDSLKEVFEYHLKDLDVQVKARKQEKIIDGFEPIVDVLIKKDNYPTSFILAKTYLGTGELRECFGNAYFTKILLGSKNTRCFVVTIENLRPTIKDLITLCGSFIDGVYSLSGKPPIDDLVSVLQNLYVDETDI